MSDENNNTSQKHIRPYARLLTMLGEQLIKNESVALNELIKNSFDADAPTAEINFVGFDENFGITSGSKIIISDTGSGMDASIIKKHWLNPATPEKHNRKRKNPTTPLGRYLQGEKGIGRFAILKLGRKVVIHTKTVKEKHLNELIYDFTMYDDDFLTKDGKQADIYLDQLQITLNEISNKRRLKKGTIIEVSDLKGKWSEQKVRKLLLDINKFQSIFPGDKPDKINAFDIKILKDNVQVPFHEEPKEKLHTLLERNSVLKVAGNYDENAGVFNFSVNGEKFQLDINGSKFRGLKPFSNTFDNMKFEEQLQTECGSFSFNFYVFDFSAKAYGKYKLDRKDKDLLRPHRIYLYRDHIRVLPYGDKNDDWLHIDQERGTKSAGDYLSNDQVVGRINISHKGNPKLSDKTNREGLIEIDNSARDFIGLLKLFLSYLRHGPYRRYQSDLDNKKESDIYQSDQVKTDFELLEEAINDNSKAKTILRRVRKAYGIERKYLIKRAERTEDLAGIGVSVEVASHDAVSLLIKALEVCDNLLRIIGNSPPNVIEIEKDLMSLRGAVSFVHDQIEGIQQMFVSTKQRRKNIRVSEIVYKVAHIYRHLLRRDNIKLEINEDGSPLIAKTTDAILLQVLINLFDNAVYWLDTSPKNNKRIMITLDGNSGRMIFSDSGNGVAKEDIPYIFQPFYSGKGEDGRGLGLYIAKQLLQRHEYDIELAELKNDKLLTGANFVTHFVTEK